MSGGIYKVSNGLAGIAAGNKYNFYFPNRALRRKVRA